MTRGRDLVIIGTGGLAKEMGQLARQIDPNATRWRQIHYCADKVETKGAKLPYGVVSFTDEEIVECKEEVDVVLGTGYPWLRERLVGQLKSNSRLRFPNLIHPSIWLDVEMVQMGEGNVITQGCVFTCDIRIGNFNMINWNSTVGHDAQIGSFNVINPAVSISGHVRVGNSCLIGTGARVIEKLTIADNIIVGAGAVVTRAIAEPGVYFGVPAKYRGRMRV